MPGAITGAACVGQMFSSGDEIYTVNVVGAPAALLSTGGGAATYDTGTRTFILVGGPITTDVFWYPAQPVMGLVNYEQEALNDEELFAFDTQFAYIFTNVTGWLRQAGGAAANTWTPSATIDAYFTVENYRGLLSNDYLMFVTNNTQADALRYWDGTNWNAFGTALTTQTDAAGSFIITARIIKSFAGRLFLMNVLESVLPGPNIERFSNKIWFSAAGSPVSGTAFRFDQNQAGFIIFPINEAITSAEIIKGNLVIYFERSTVILRFTNDSISPFDFEVINNELGVESTRSMIKFDEVILGFGPNGIHACNGVNVQRIDSEIPNTIFEVNNTESGPQRVAGIRDYWTETVYWSYNSIISQTDSNRIWPNRVLVYNYKDNNWAYNDDSISAFGNFYLQQNLTWAGLTDPWLELSLAWSSGSSSENFRSVVCGNQEGFTFILDSGTSSNSVALQITDITIIDPIITITAVDHNLADASYVVLSGINGGVNLTNLNDQVFQVDTLTVDTFTIQRAGISGTYTGGGSITRVSEIEILTKQYNFYLKEGVNTRLFQVDFLVGRTALGEINVEPLISSSSRSMFNDAIDTDTLIGTSDLQTTPYALKPLESSQDRFWHSLYYQIEGEFIQLHFCFTEDQILAFNEAIVLGTPRVDVINSPFELDGLIFSAQPTGRI